MFENLKLLQENLPKQCLQLLEMQWEKGHQLLAKEPHIAEKALYNLTKWMVIRALLPYYRKCSIPSSSQEIFVMSSIWSDGIGDYITLLRIASEIQKQFPSFSVQVVYHHKQTLPQIDFFKQFQLPEKNVHVFKETDLIHSQILQPIIEKPQQILPFEVTYLRLKKEIDADQQAQKERENKGLQRNSALNICIQENEEEAQKLFGYFDIKSKALHIRERLEKSPAIVHVALAIDTFTDLSLKSKSLYFSESGNFQGVENSLAFNWYSLGLQPFDEGFYLPKVSSQTSDHIDDLLHFFSLKAQSYYVGYFSPFPLDTMRLFIYMLCSLHISNLKDDLLSDLVIFLPIHDFDALQLDFAWLASLSTSELSFYQNKQLIKKIDFSSPKSSFKLILINCFPLSLEDFHILSNSSKEIIGCTGDSSFGECLAMGKVPFYQTRPHKTETLLGLIGLIKSCCGSESPLISYFKALSQLDNSLSKEALAKELASYLKQPRFFSDWNTIIDEIYSHYNLKDNLLGRLKRHLFLTNNRSELKKEENIILQIFSEKNIE